MEAVVRSMGEGLLAIPAGETVVRFLPPLNVTAAEIDEAVKKFAAAIGKSENGADPAPLHHS
jgi:acetylornithine/succinyldiaminopimelate/putrescine aminotransferase